MAVFLQHLDETIQTLTHLLSTMVLDDERHLELRMFLELEELPGVEIGNEMTVSLQRATDHPVVQPFGQVMERQPKQRESDEWRDRGRNLQHAVFHERRAGIGQMHVTTRNKSRIQRRIVQIARPFDFRCSGCHSITCLKGYTTGWCVAR